MKVNDAIEDFIEKDLSKYKTTEREIFKLILKDCTRGILAVKATNDTPSTTNIIKEEKVLKEIISQL